MRQLGKYKHTSLLYKASRDGFSSESFHKHCDMKGPTITIVKTSLFGQKESFLGGFTSQNWQSLPVGEYSKDDEAFMFSLDKEKKFDIIERECAIYNFEYHGPTFGSGWDLYVCDNSNEERRSFCTLGHSFKVPQDILERIRTNAILETSYLF